MKTLVTLIALALVLFGAPTARSQAHPAENSQLHYRLIGFQFQQKQGVTCSLEIAEGTFNSLPEFRKHIIKRYRSTSGKVIGEVPRFGAGYTWRVVRPGIEAKPVFHHFSTMELPAFLNNQPYRLRIIKAAEKYNDAAVFTDKNHVLYDMKGNPLWFLPKIGNNINDNTEIRNLKVSRRGTITFTTFDLAYEISYDGEVLWVTPNDGQVSGEPTERYHHQLTILPNYHYMILGTEMIPWAYGPTASGDSAIHIISDVEKDSFVTNKIPFSETPFGTVIEYDTNSRVVWSWRSANYLLKDFSDNPKNGKFLYEAHENAFFFDDNRKYLYVSFKNNNQVLKVKYPSGEVVNAYGSPDGYEPSEEGNLFCNQHSCKLSKKGYLYLYNNNFCNPGSVPSVLMMEEPPAGQNKLKKIWEYTYPYNKSQMAKMKETWTMGGNVIELPGSEIFVSMCLPYGNIFIVTLEKKILWDALLERWNPAKNEWERQSSYRASIIKSRKDLESLIWGQPLNSLKPAR